jgi:hypothetical protein
MAQRLAIVIAVLYLIAGCQFLPVVEHQPTFHNPFPQLSRVGVAPFINASTEGTLNGRNVALAYFNELQAIPGFEVTPVGIIELKAQDMGLRLSNPDEIRAVARELKLDAIIVGVITDYTPYYPPRMALRVDWYAANPGFHPIPTGYGLPWGTPAEEEIPQTLVEATEFELAREQLQTQAPDYRTEDVLPLMQGKREAPGGVLSMQPKPKLPPFIDPKMRQQIDKRGTLEEPVKIQIPPEQEHTASEKTATKPASAVQGAETAESKNQLTLAQYHAAAAGQLPADWPDPSGFIPAPPSAMKPPLRPQTRPVLTHTRNYNGNDSDFTRSLESYAAFRDDARFGGWQGYLTRSDDFIRFCCHLHLTEMLTARGGASETRVVWHWGIRR